MRRKHALNRLIRMFALFFVLLFAAPATQAALNCTISAPTMSFGTLSVVPIPQTDTTPNLTVNCTGGAANATVRMCVGINDGTGAGSASPQRFMSSGADAIEFQVYSDAAHSATWGSTLFAGGMQEVLPSIVLNAAGSGGGSFPMYGRILNPPAQTKPTGTYASTLQFSVKYPSGGSGCGAGSGSGTLFTSGTFEARVIIAASCTIVAADIDFGTRASLATPVDTTGGLSVTCTSGRPYTIALNAGSSVGNTIAARKMSRNGVGAGVVSYQLYRDSGPSNVWGDGASGVVYSGTGSGANQAIPVYANLPAQAAQAPGTYIDTVRATVTY
jgi:spore coat protein U-like protein